MAPTTSKGVRLTPHELERLNRLRPFFPEAATEAEMIRFATQRGLALMEAEVAASGGGMPSGIREEDLATIILPRIIVTVLWLTRIGRLDGVAPAPVSGGTIDATTIDATTIDATTIDADAPQETEEEAFVIDPSAAGDIDALGGEFLGGWPEFDEEEDSPSSSH